MAQKETITTNEYTYTAVFEPAVEGGYTVTVPALPGVVTEAETLEEAREMVADAIQCYLESLQKDNLPLPQSDTGTAAPVAEKVKVQLKIA